MNAARKAIDFKFNVAALQEYTYLDGNTFWTALFKKSSTSLIVAYRQNELKKLHKPT